MSDQPTGAGEPLDFAPRHLIGAGIGALVVALYAAWMAADLVSRWITVPAVVLIAGYFLFQRADAGAKIVFVGYALAGLLILTPLFVILPEIFSGFDGGLSTRVFGVANLLLVIVFVVPGLIVAYATYRFDGGSGIVQSARLRLSG